MPNGKSRPLSTKSKQAFSLRIRAKVDCLYMAESRTRLNQAQLAPLLFRQCRAWAPRKRDLASMRHRCAKYFSVLFETICLRVVQMLSLITLWLKDAATIEYNLRMDRPASFNHSIIQSVPEVSQRWKLVFFIKPKATSMLLYTSVHVTCTFHYIGPRHMLAHCASICQGPIQ